MQLTSKQSGLVDLRLTNCSKEDRHDRRKVDGKFLPIYSREDGEEDVRAFLEVGCIRHGESFESCAHQRFVVGAEHVFTDGFSECADCVLGDAAEIEFFSLFGQSEERNNALHGRLEIGSKLGLGGVRG